jgi:release factor glutamine methyltransferase
MNLTKFSTTTIQTALRMAVRKLFPFHKTARIDAEVLLAHGIKRTRAYLHTWPENLLSSEQIHHFMSLVQRRAAGEPVAYLTGIREFWSLPLTVTRATLVPRPETELLVEQALQRISYTTSSHIADLGTGCGAIALAIASERPASRVVATDIDKEALVVARQNAEKLSIPNVEFRQGTWFSPIMGERYHVITSNPPYIGKNDPHVSRGDVSYEPRGALIAGLDGLEAISILVSEAKTHLFRQGWLIVEHGYDQQGSVIKLFAAHGYKNIQGLTDYAGQGRVVIGQYLPLQTQEI